MIQAEVYVKYGLTAKALEQLQQLLAIAPQHTAGKADRSAPRRSPARRVLRIECGYLVAWSHFAEGSGQ